MSLRSDLTIRRTYARPKYDGTFETWEEIVDRVISHQHRLWQDAGGTPDLAELDALRTVMLRKEGSVAGRTLWLGGTDIAYRRACSQFNCSFLEFETVHDAVDAFWLLLNGCGVGFRPVPGTLNGFARPLEVEFIRSQRLAHHKGHPNNEEIFDGTTWTIRVGDSAEAWARSLGKLLAGKFPAQKLVVDLSEIRGAGHRLAGYGWISSGDQSLANAFGAICTILNRRAGELLSALDLLDVMNWLGTALSTRRASEIALYQYGDSEWESFAEAKQNYMERGLFHRSQSNNSLLFWQKPSKQEIRGLLELMQDNEGGDPGLYNAAEARRRAPWFRGTNPCGEILLGNRSFCNLTETVCSKFNGRFDELNRTVWLLARANYRQTCVDLRDGVLQESWHQNNQFLRLCGVGLTGIAGWHHIPDDLKHLQWTAQTGARDMASQLGLPWPKAVTTVKPSGTMSKALDAEGEGIHQPLGRYIFNNIAFSRHDPIVAKLRRANYFIFDSPYDQNGVIVRVPVFNANAPLRNSEKAVDQLNRYKAFMENWVDHNASITVSYERKEIKQIADWLDKNWDSYVGVSFLERDDKAHPYYPQEIVDYETFRAYEASLKPVHLDKEDQIEGFDDTADCAGGVCPIR